MIEMIQIYLSEFHAVETATTEDAGMNDNE